ILGGQAFALRFFIALAIEHACLSFHPVALGRATRIADRNAHAAVVADALDLAAIPDRPHIELAALRHHPDRRDDAFAALAERFQRDIGGVADLLELHV